MCTRAPPGGPGRGPCPGVRKPGKGGVMWLYQGRILCTQRPGAWLAHAFSTKFPIFYEHHLLSSTEKIIYIRNAQCVTAWPRSAPRRAVATSIPPFCLNAWACLSDLGLRGPHSICGRSNSDRVFHFFERCSDSPHLRGRRFEGSFCVGIRVDQAERPWPRRGRPLEPFAHGVRARPESHRRPVNGPPFSGLLHPLRVSPFICHSLGPIPDHPGVYGS